jgi:hypothetical protein
MMKKWIIAAALMAMSPMPAFAQTAYSSTTTEIGTLLDDPAAKAILEKHIPGMTTNDQVDMARSMTLKDIQQYSPDQITDKVLAEVDAELAKLKK